VDSDLNVPNIVLIIMEMTSVKGVLFAQNADRDNFMVGFASLYLFVSRYLHALIVFRMEYDMHVWSPKGLCW
jgi:hypothetical protein